MRIRAAVLSMTLACLAVAAAPAVPAPATSALGGLTLYHWWTSSSELAAVDSLVQAFKAQYPNVDVRPKDAHAHGGGGKMFVAISGAAATGHPPDAFQVHAGAPLRPYFDAGLVSPIDEVWAASGLEKTVPPIIRTMSTIDGHYYSIPINVHRDNLIWYNKTLLDQHHIDPATLTSWDAFFKAADKLRADGVTSPIQIGESWTASVAFESMMASLGMAAYEDWINGKITAPGDPRLLEAFGLLKKHLSYANRDYAKTPWDVAIRRVISANSAFCIMGDWANGEFRLAKMEYGRDYGAIPVPGTRGFYGVTVDSFAETRGIADPANANRWMRLAASREGQDAFNVAKGSISARSDAGVSRYDPYQRAAIGELKAAKVIYPNLSSATHDAFKTSLDNVMTDFGRDPDVAKAAAAVAAAAADSQKKFTQVWSLK